MARERLFWCASVGALAVAVATFGACSSDDKPNSLVTGGGASSRAGGAGDTSSNAGSAIGGAASGGGGTPGAGEATGEGGAVAEPVATFQSSLEADVGCNMTTPDASLVISNTGDEPLVILSATADSGYIVKTKLPLDIAPQTSGALVVTPPAPSATADAGAVSSGKLTFTTNEPGSHSHVVTLNTSVFEGSFEFTDSDGTPITSVKLGYDSANSCPNPAKFRIHNTGNATFTVLGPAFPAHFGGTTLGTAGRAIPPDGFAEMLVGGVSAPGDVCSGAGALSFTVMGPFCGAVPQLALTWPASTDPDAGTDCTCAAPQ